MSLVPFEASNAVAVSDYLSKARDWLATAVEMTGPEQIAMAKAEIATAAEATKQLGLSKGIQEDAAEMVRRAEWALRRAQRKAQDEGTMRSRATNLVNQSRSAETVTSSPRDQFASTPEYRDALAMGELDADEFEAILTEAKAEGNLSRANVARKARETTGRATPRRGLPDVARDLGIDLRRLTERVERLHDDDRFGRNKNEVAAHLRHHLAHALKVLTDLEQEINSQEESTE